MGWGKGTIITMPGGGNSMLSGTIKMREEAVMALSDGKYTVSEIEQMEEILASNWQKAQRIIREDEEACSEERTYSEKDSTWTYVTVHDEYVRIIKCETEHEHLEIPQTIEDLPVAELAVDCCSYLEHVRSIVCSPQIERIGKCAFRECRALEKLVLPLNVDEYDSSWVRGCIKLSELALPGGLEKITSSIFSVGDVRALTLGRAAREFIGNPFSGSKLEKLFIDEQNPYLSTDGNAIFSKDGTYIFALALDCESYNIPAGCEVIGNKAFANRSGLTHINFPDTISTIEDHAFSYSGLVEFIAPSSLRSIGERAFFRCRDLSQVILNEGLLSIGAEAFTGTAISTLHLPSTLEDLGMNFVDKTPLVLTGKDAGLSIEPNGRLEMDDKGGLYRNVENGRHFVRMLEDEIERYEIKQGTLEIEAFAFFKHPKIQEVVLPEGLRSIGKAAFRDARLLERADFPSTLEAVGEEAFLDTSLSRVNIPAGLTVLGETALVTYGAHNGKSAPTLKEIEVHPDNPRFYSVPSLLIERHEGAGSHVVVYADSGVAVVVPEDVSVIDKYAFGGARNLSDFTVSNRVRKIDMRGLSIDCLIEHLYLELAKPIEGHEYFDLHFPVAERSAHEQQLAFNLSTSVHPTNILKHYDSSIVNMHSFGKAEENGDEEVDLYLQAKLSLDRLVDPVLMTPTNKTLLMANLNDNLEEICEAIARHDDRKAIDDMLELGILNEDNLLDIIDRVGKLQDAAMTGYLLEIKRRLFGADAIDFDL